MTTYERKTISNMDPKGNFTSFKVQEKPAITEIEMGVVPILMHQVINLAIKDLNE